uniref:E3 ubiquitin protein ligase n=1 Tax=Geospiza parvula TaxID=87175 RepID=A0A8C3MPG1_GEOPR
MSGIGNKWTAGEPGPSAPPEKKAGLKIWEELDIRTLQTKNRKLAEMLDQRQAIEDDLREHIEKLERRQATDDASLLIINRYWNQFDENIRIILKRFDLDQGLGDLLSERKALVVPGPEPDSDSNQECKDERERGEGRTGAGILLPGHLASSTSEEIESQLQGHMESSCCALAQIVTMYDKLQEKVDVLSHKLNSGDISLMEETVVELNTYLSHDNGRLQELADVLSGEFSKLQERVETAESRVSVLETMIDDLQWDIDKIRKREQRLNRHLADVLERVNSKGYKVYGPRSSLYGGTITIQGKFEEMNAEGEESKELAGNRLNELEELCQDLEEVTRQNEKLKVRHPYLLRDKQKCCSVMWQNDNSLILFLSLSLSLFSISMKVLKKVGRSVVCCRGVSVFAGPINREMRHLISSLQNHNHQLKGEVLRYKRKLREAQADLSKISSRSGSALLQSQSSTEDTKEEPAEIKQEPDDPSAQVTVPRAASEAVNEMKARQDEEEREEREGKGTRVGKAEAEGVREGERESKEKEKGKHEDGRKKEAEVIKQLKTELKKEKAQESQKEMKLLLDIYCSAPKEQRDKVQLMAAEKAKAEVFLISLPFFFLMCYLNFFSDTLQQNLEEQIEYLQKKLHMAKCAPWGWGSRGSFSCSWNDSSEDAQSMHSFIPSVPSVSLSKVDAQLQVVHKLEEKEHLLQSSIGTGEKELGLRTQALEMNKRKAMDAAQLADDLKAQLELAQKKEKEMFNFKRAEEDISRLHRRLESTKKPDMVPNCDEIPMEEIKDYKACLMCPCCSMHKKDAVLTKCFHVSCLECVQTRYNTRHRKCPECSVAFGASDSHRIYIG